MDSIISRPQPASLPTLQWPDVDAYLFDIDGTLLVTRDFVHWNALNRAMLEVYGVDTTIEGIAYHGKTDLGILRAALERIGISGEAFEEKLPDALEVICRDVSAHAEEIQAELCPSIPEVLQKLQQSEKLLAIASGNLASVGWQKVETAGLRNFFSFGCYSDKYEMRGDIFTAAIQEVRNRLGKEAEVCFIGDTPEDIKAARKAGGQVVAVSTGIFSLQELQSHSPDLCVSCCTDLLSL
jgi:phosphoglycolate phosphatase-like HAD superfamily hydrolase